MKAERRRYEREDRGGKVKLHWKTADGLSYSVTGKLLNVSRNGARLMVDRRLDTGMVVHMESAELRVVGVVRVRHVKPAGLQWEVGLEFTGGMEWRRVSEPGGH